MAYYWATWLYNALASDPFVKPRIVQTKSWETRGRPPSQFSFMPSGVLDHHTACMCKVGHRPDNCLSPIINGHSGVPGPISQLLGTMTPLGVAWTGTNPDPRIIIVGAGRANHAGTGTWPWGAPGGNGSAIGIEWCGPPSTQWPDVVVELRARVTAAILRHNGWPISRSTIHWEYATPQGRKIDPSGRWKREPSLGQISHWNPSLWRTEIASYLSLAPTKPPPTTTPLPLPPRPASGTTEGMEKMLIAKYGGTPTANWGGWYSCDGGVTRKAVSSMAQAATLVDLGALDAKTRARVTDREWDGVSHTTSVATLDQWLTPYG